MKNTFVFILLIVSIFALPQKYNTNLKFDELELKLKQSRYEVAKKISIQRKEFQSVLDFCQTNTDDDLVAVYNACTDKLFEIIDGYLAANYDPLSMPDMHSGFNYTLIITYHGELDLTNGQLKDFSTIHRGGDVNISIDLFKGEASFTLPMAFDDLAFTYDYTAKIMGLGPSGGIEGNVKNLEMNVQLSMDIFNKVVRLDSFDITNSGHINFEFTGHALIDWLLNLLTDVVTALLKKVMLNIMETVVGGALEGAVEAINEILANNTIAIDANGSVKFAEGYETYLKNKI